MLYKASTHPPGNTSWTSGSMGHCQYPKGEVREPVGQHLSDLSLERGLEVAGVRVRGRVVLVKERAHIAANHLLPAILGDVVHCTHNES